MMEQFRRQPNWPETWPGPEYTDRPTLVDLLERSKTEPQLMKDLTNQTIATLQYWGVGENWKAVVRWLGLPEEMSPVQVRDKILAFLQDKNCSV